MPTIGSGRVQPVTGTITFATTAPSSGEPLTGFAVKTPSEGINLFENVETLGGTATLFLRSMVVGAGLRLNVTNGVLYLNILESSLPIGPSGVTGPIGPSFYDIVGYWRGLLPTDTAPIHYLEMVRPIALSAGLAGSVARCTTAPITDVALTLAKNGTSVGTMNFVAFQNIGSFTFPATVTFAAGDVWEVRPPNPQDQTFAGLSWTIIATVL